MVTRLLRTTKPAAHKFVGAPKSMTTASDVRHIIEALCKSRRPAPAAAAVARSPGDPGLLVMGVVMGIAIAAAALVWRLRQE